MADGIFDTPGASPDTSGNEASEAGNQPDSATTETQNQAQAAPAEGTPAQDAAAQAERLLAGKYRTPEELERAYIEAQQLIGRQGQELARLRTQAPPIPGLGHPAQQPAPAAQAAQVAPIPQIDPEKLEADFSQRLLDKPLTSVLQVAQAVAAQHMQPLRQEIQRLQEELTLSRLRTTLPDFAPLEPVVKQIVACIPELRNYGDGGFHAAYLMAKAQYAQQAVAQAHAQGAAQGEAAAAAKLAGSSVAGASKRQEPQNLTPEQRIVQGALAAWKEKKGGLF